MTRNEQVAAAIIIVGLTLLIVFLYLRPATAANVPTCSKHTVPYTAVQTGAPTSAITLFELPARGKITALTIKHSIAFAGSGISAVSLSIGRSGSSAAYSAPFDIFQAVSNTAMQDDGGQYSADFGAHTITATFTANTNLSNLTQGSVDIWACTVMLP